MNMWMTSPSSHVKLNSMKPRKSKVLAAILALFGGNIGLPRFYLGEFQIGIFMIIFTAILFPYTMVVNLFEFLRIFSMGQSEFDRKYNKHLLNGQQPRRSSKRKAKTQPKKSTNYKKRENPYKKTGFKKYKEYDIEGAIDDLEKSLEIDPNDKDIYFQLACGYSLMERPEDSLQFLQSAIQLGYDNYENINTIDDLAYLRISPVYQTYKANGYSTSPKARLAAPKQDLLQDDMLLSQLKKLSELRQRGLLSDTDFQLQKQKLMRR